MSKSCKSCQKCNKKTRHLYESYDPHNYKYIKVCGDCLPQLVMDNKTEKRRDRAEKEKFVPLT